MAIDDLSRFTDPSNPHDEPVPGVAPWRDANGVWHFGGDAGRGGGSVGGVQPGSGNTPPGGTTAPTSGVTPPRGNNIADLITQLGGGLLSGLGQIFGQQKRQSFSGTAADPVTALSGVQRRISDFAEPMGQRATSGVTRNDGSAATPTSQDYEHLKATLRSMGVHL